MIELWPWWAGALALFTTSIGFVLALGRPLGVSGAIASVLDPDERRAEKVDQEALDDELERATREMFGDAALAAAATLSADAAPEARARKLGWTTSALFLAAVVAGGFLAAASTGTLGGALDDAYRAMFGDGALAYAVLLAGGVLVGFGTQLAGGCTSGHGLVGCARVQPGSLVATATFFGTAIAASFVLDALLGASR